MREKEPMSYEQCLHELRKAQKGLRRTRRKLMIAEGILAKIYKESYNSSLSDSERLSRVRSLVRSVFFDGWTVYKASHIHDIYLMYKGRYHV